MSRSRSGGWFRLALACCLLAGVAGCNSSVGHDGSSSRWKIFCTTGQVADALQAIAGEHGHVTGLMGPGVDPHLYRAVPADIARLQAADIVFYNGLHLEGRIIETLERLKRHKPVVAVTAGLVERDDPRLLKPQGFAGLYDPHVWHDAKLWAECVLYAAERLAEFDPLRADDYRANARAYVDRLEQLHEFARAQIQTIPAEQRLLVTAHDAFGYFSKAYGLQAVGLKGISTEDEVDIQHMDEVIALLVRQKIPAVFVESSTAPRIVEALIEPCRRQGHEVRVGGELYADALGPEGSGAETYEGMLRANVKTIVDGLRE